MIEVSADFTALGNGANINIQHRASYTYDVAGTFVGTVVLERTVNGGLSWEAILSATSTGSGTLMIETPAQLPAQVRFRCSAFTSGTIETTLTAVAAVVSVGGTPAIFKDANGNTVMTVKEDGIHTIGEAVDVPPLT